MKDELRNNAPDSGAEGSGAESWKVSEIQQRDETSKRQVSVEQWQGRTTVKVRDVGRISAEHCVSELFGTVEIFEKPASQASKRLPAISDTLKNGPYNSPVKLSIQITNVPEVSLGVRNIDDLMALGTGIACGFKRAGLDTLDYLTTPGAVNSTLMQIGPALDNALNYYARTPAERVSSDGQRAAAYAWQVLENTIGHHLTPARSGEFAGAAMPAFFPIGRRKSLGKKGPQSLGIEQPFAETTRGEAKSLGLKQAPERITESHSLGLRRAPRAGGDWMVINERP
jgi:hypothetical protein